MTPCSTAPASERATGEAEPLEYHAGIGQGTSGTAAGTTDRAGTTDTADGIGASRSNTAAAPHAWTWGMRWWDGYFGLVIAASVTIVWLEGAASPDRVGAVAALLAIAPVYVLIGRRPVLSDETTWRNYAYPAALVVLFAIAANLQMDSCSLSPRTASWCSARPWPYWPCSR